MGLLAEMQRTSRERVREARTRVPEAALRASELGASPPPQLSLSAVGFDLIAEMKLRSPSVGDLAAQTIDPVQRLEAYAEGGAAIVSVLTEPSRFGGELEHLRLASDTLGPYRVPVMRKDFLVDPYQVLEARAYGASGVLLIVRMLSREGLIEMLDCAAEHRLFVLLEAFDADDLEVASELALERKERDERVLMGLNCRNLESLEIDFRRFSVLRDKLPSQWPGVAESGVQQAADARAVAALGYRLALVGTCLMRDAEPAAAVARLLAAGRGEVTGPS